MSSASDFRKLNKPATQTAQNGTNGHISSDVLHTVDPSTVVLEDPLDAENRQLGPYTVDDMEVYLDQHELRVELYNGWLVWRKMTDKRERTVLSTIQDMLSVPARKAAFGQVLPDLTECVLDNGNTIIPDAALISWDRLEKDFILHGPNDRPLLIRCPELIIESRSPSNRRKQERLKRGKYFDNGTEVVWDVDEPNQQIYVYRVEDQDNPEVYGVDDVIECKPFLANWKRRVADIFAERVSAEAVVGEVVDEWRQEGREEGREEGRLEVAKALLDILDDETISLKTGIPLAQIQALHNADSL